MGRGQRRLAEGGGGDIYRERRGEKEKCESDKDELWNRWR